MSEGLSTRGYIDESGGGGGGVQPTGTVTVNLNTITVTWSTPVNLTVDGALPINWVIVPITGKPFSVLSIVQFDSTTTVLTTSDQTLNGSYQIQISAAVVVDQVSGDPNFYFVVSFLGDGHLPSFGSAVPQTSTSVLCTFSEPVLLADIRTNYSIDNGLNVTNVTVISSTEYLLTTTEMDPGVIYTVTVSNITDLAGNPVT